jgi:ferritin-like protein
VRLFTLDSGTPALVPSKVKNSSSEFGLSTLNLLGLRRSQNQIERRKFMATSAEWHENYDEMSEDALNFSRAVKSVQEELEAVDWYNQRAQATKDEQLRRILEHNRDEEIEHAMMGLEYLRRINPVFNQHMRTYLFTEGDITEIEEKAEK